MNFTKHELKMLNRLRARLAILNHRLFCGGLKNPQDIVAEARALEWAINRLCKEAA